MALLKCLLAGLLSMVVVAILLVVALMVFVLPTAEKGTAVGFDPISMVRSWPLQALLITSLSFAMGFLWEYKRVR